jgi:hypothetical protein
MYLRTIRRRKKDGSEVGYVQLAHNVWDPARRQARAQVIHSFGREDQLDREALARLVRSITRFLDPEQALAAQAPEGLRFLHSRPMGGAWVLDQLWRGLGLGAALQRVAAAAGDAAGGAAFVRARLQPGARSDVEAGRAGVGAARRLAARGR